MASFRREMYEVIAEIRIAFDISEELGQLLESIGTSLRGAIPPTPPEAMASREALDDWSSKIASGILKHVLECEKDVEAALPLLLRQLQRGPE